MSYRFADSLWAGSGRSVLILLASYMTYTIAVCTGMTYTIGVCTGLLTAVWHIPLLCVQWKTPDDGQRNCPKHVEFYCKNKSEKLVHLVGFIIRTGEQIGQNIKLTYKPFMYTHYVVHNFIIISNKYNVHWIRNVVTKFQVFNKIMHEQKTGNKHCDRAAHELAYGPLWFCWCTLTFQRILLQMDAACFIEMYPQCHNMHDQMKL